MSDTGLRDVVATTSPLRELAGFHGIQTGYEDWQGRWHEASDAALVAALGALDVPLEGPGGAPEALERSRARRWSEPLDPVTAAIGLRDVTVHLRVPRRQSEEVVRCDLAHESGERHRWEVDLGGVEPTHVQAVDGIEYAALPLRVENLPQGYHRFEVEHAGTRDATTLVIAPARAWQPPTARRGWGFFLPLYALRTARDWGAGDLTDFDELAAWGHEVGAGIVGTLPLLPTYLGEDDHVPFDPSPYSPVSRRFWNELYLDLARAPELERSEPARALLASDEVAASVAELRRRPLVDYRGLAALKTEVLDHLAHAFFAEPDGRRDDFERFVEERPLVEDYALFRGAVARWGSDWAGWPRQPRGDDRRLDAVDADVARRHAYAQFLAHEQISSLSDDLRGRGQHPYLDLPLGTRADGFDVWYEPHLFASRASVGAPPDKVFTGGQDWAFPPLHPQRVREDGYRHLRDVLGHHLALADQLRIDHVMGLHRLFWIPDGVDADDGVYVRYRADELYAVVLLESHRHRSRIVGENLGTVPREVEEACRERGILRMYVAQYEVRADEDPALPPVPHDTVASVNTHDMAPFAAFWHGHDIDDGVDLGLADEDEAKVQHAEREVLRTRLADTLVDSGLLASGDRDDPAAVHTALLAWLGRSEAALVLANLEDCWLETERQNTPGTQTERDNWRPRARHDLTDIRTRASVVDTLRSLNDTRTTGDQKP